MPQHIDMGALLRNIALDAIADATVGSDEGASSTSLSRVVLELLSHVETAAADRAKREMEQAAAEGDDALQRDFDARELTAACLNSTDFRMTDGMALTRYLTLLIGAADQVLSSAGFGTAEKKSFSETPSAAASGGRRALGMKERVRTRNQTIAFREAAEARAEEAGQTTAADTVSPSPEHASARPSDQQPSTAENGVADADTDGVVAVSSSSEAGGDEGDATNHHQPADWSAHWLGAEVAVEACSLLQILGLTLNAERLYRLLAAAFVHTTYLFALRAAASFGSGADSLERHPSLVRYHRPSVTRATLESVAEQFAFSAGCCDDEELLVWHAALCELLPQEMGTRIDDARADAEKGGNIRLRRKQSIVQRRRRSSAAMATASAETPRRRSSVMNLAAAVPPGAAHVGVDEDDAAPRPKSSASTTKEEDEADDDALDAEYYRRGHAEKKVVVAFYYVLAELQQLDAAWAAWVPERSAAARTFRSDQDARHKSGVFARRRASQAAAAVSDASDNS